MSGPPNSTNITFGALNLGGTLIVGINLRNSGTETATDIEWRVDYGVNQHPFKADSYINGAYGNGYITGRLPTLRPGEMMVASVKLLPIASGKISITGWCSASNDSNPGNNSLPLTEVNVIDTSNKAFAFGYTSVSYDHSRDMLVMVPQSGGEIFTHVMSENRINHFPTGELINSALHSSGGSVYTYGWNKILNRYDLTTGQAFPIFTNTVLGIAMPSGSTSIVAARLTESIRIFRNNQYWRSLYESGNFTFSADGQVLYFMPLGGIAGEDYSYCDLRVYDVSSTDLNLVKIFPVCDKTGIFEVRGELVFFQDGKVFNMTTAQYQAPIPSEAAQSKILPEAGGGVVTFQNAATSWVIRRYSNTMQPLGSIIVPKSPRELDEVSPHFSVTLVGENQIAVATSEQVRVITLPGLPLGGFRLNINRDQQSGLTASFGTTADKNYTVQKRAIIGAGTWTDATNIL